MVPKELPMSTLQWHLPGIEFDQWQSCMYKTGRDVNISWTLSHYTHSQGISAVPSGMDYMLEWNTGMTFDLKSLAIPHCFGSQNNSKKPDYCRVLSGSSLGLLFPLQSVNWSPTSTAINKTSHLSYFHFYICLGWVFTHRIWPPHIPAKPH